MAFWSVFIPLGIVIAVSVEYSGRVIATIRDKSVFDDAIALAVNSVGSEKVKTVIAQPQFNPVVTVSHKLEDAPRLAKAIIENTEEIVEASALLVNGEVATCVESGDLKSYLNECLSRYYIEGAKNESEFVDNIEVVDGLYLRSDIDAFDIAKRVIDTLPVKTVSVVETETAVAYSTVTQKTAEKQIGYSEVTTKGVEGVNRVVESIVKINNEECERTQVSNTLVRPPVDEVILVGTARIIAASPKKASTASSGFAFPLRCSWTCSAGYGDGRNHKGVDLAADKGSDICAVLSGTVTFSGYDGGYGYSVVIDHGNGIQTRYAHASSLYVKCGQNVYQGEVIAAVGSTGSSTGNHLHFEVIVNGARMNPAPYLGLK